MSPDEGRRPVRGRTVVFGLVLLALAVAVLVSALTDLHVDAGSVALAVLIGAGALLVVSGIRSATRGAPSPDASPR
jgi:hypothetical protein